MNLRSRLFRTAAKAAVVAGVSAAFAGTALGACLNPPGDVTNDGQTTVLDVQCSVLANLWSLGGQVGQVPECIAVPGSPAVVVDHNCDGIINVADTILAIQFALKVLLNPLVDANGNQCVDACETDLDGDGTFDVLDCAPMNPNIFAGATEQCNGYDDNCDGQIDLGAASVQQSCSNNDVCDGIESCQQIPTNLGVIITELMIAPAAVTAAQGQWVELFNSGLTAVNIQGWRITNEAGQVHTIDAGGALFVPPRGYLVLANNKDLASNGGVRVSYQYSSFTMGGASQVIALLDTNLALRDRVPYANAGFPTASGRSIALADVRLNNELGSSWAASTVTFVADPSTPWGPNVDVLPGFCQNGTPLVCNDQNPCTDDACDPTDGCVAVNNSLPCDDGEICTTSDTCAGGACVGGAPPVCDDANPCTTDSCAPGVGCVFTNNTLPCDDANECTTQDTCANGMCMGGPALVCDDANLCTTDSCAPATGCVFANNTLPCDNGNPCTTGDTCGGGSCQAGGATICDDGNVCTTDSCDPASGCVSANNTLPCDDANACTTADTCANGMCIGGPAPNCDDGNLCTTDSCNPATGCVNTPNSAPCGDDGNPCTQDVCNPATGSCGVPAADGTSCDDGDVCTVPDICESGQCVSSDFEPCESGFNLLCVISGNNGATVECPIQIASASGPKATALELRLSYPSYLDLAYFTDGDKCFGPSGGPPCIPNIITGAAPSTMLSGHGVYVEGNTIDNWTTGGRVVIIDFSSPSNVLSDAVWSGNGVMGDPTILRAIFVLTQTVPAGTPTYVSADVSDPEPVVAVDGFATTLTVDIEGAMIITSSP